MPSVHITESAIPEFESGRSRTWLLLVFALLLAWQIVLVWIYPRFATQDGPSHLYNSALIRSFHDPAWSRIPEFYRLNSRPIPNWFTYAFLAALYSVFSPPIAEKILVTGYFIAFPLSFAYVSRVLTKHVSLFAIWGLVLADNYFIAMGFYNFCYSLVFFLLCFGYWMKWRERFGLRQLLTMCVLGFLLYFTHPVGFLMEVIFVGAVGFFFALTECCLHGENRASGRSSFLLLKRVLLPLLAFVPCLLIFFVSAYGSQPEPSPIGRTLMQRINLLHELYVLVETREALGIVRVCLSAGFLLWAFWVVVFEAVKQRKFAPVDGLGILAVTCLLVYVVLPWSISGGGLIPDRMAWFGICGALLWLGSKAWSIRGSRVVVCVSILVVSLGLVAQTSWRYRLSPMLKAYSDAGRLMEPQKTILSLCYCNPEGNPVQVLVDSRVRPFEHAGEIAALESHAMSITNYEARGSSFPIMYNPGVNPALHFATWRSFTSSPQLTDIADYEKQTGKTVDYVLIWGNGYEVPVENGSILDLQLRSNYEITYTSPAPASLRLFKRRPASSIAESAVVTRHWRSLNGRLEFR
jgi:hypothetical protein